VPGAADRYRSESEAEVRHFVVNLSFRDGGPPPEAMQSQRAFLNDLLGEGTLVMAGRFADAGGGMSILRADSAEAARERFSSSPLVRGDHVEWELREWTVTVGAEAGR
jgi:uncharacterized protein YciI